jgi:GNAT superfamily N-acetyltransferase
MTAAFHDATQVDYPEFARLFPELGTGDPVPDLEHWLKDSAPSTFLATRGSAVVGYAFYRLFAGAGYVANVVVDPGQRGRGYGREIMRELARRFRAAGAVEWSLNVKPENTAAIALYRSVGMQRAFDSMVLRLSWDQVERLPVQPGLAVRDLSVNEDSHVNAAFGLPDGKLAELRTHAERRTLGLFEGQKPCGVAGLNLAFAPGIMGAFPFQVSRVALARNLFDAMRACGGTGHVSAQAVVENDAPLVGYLLGVGAEVHLKIEHHRGLVPEES